jgi:hypothetical protein
MTTTGGLTYLSRDLVARKVNASLGVYIQRSRLSYAPTHHAYIFNMQMRSLLP